jgi:hypothetical protein
MSNTNGLIASSDVASTGDPNSDFFVRKGQAIAVPSPIQIISPNGNEVGSITEDNTGRMILSTDSDVSLVPGSGTVSVVADGGANKGLVVKPATEATGVASITLRNGATATTPSYYTLYNASVAGGGLTSGNLQLFGYSGSPTVIREIFEFNPTGSSLALGDSSTVGGANVFVQGTLGAGRVYDTLYNIPPAPPAPVAFNEVFTWTTDMTSGQNLTTFTIPATGLYMLYTYIDLTSASLATNDVNNFFVNFLLYGDPSHSALVVPQTQSQIASFSMTKAPSTNFGYVSTQIIMPLANNTYEPNQRYKFAKSQNGGYTGGTVTIKLYRLA